MEQPQSLLCVEKGKSLQNKTEALLWSPTKSLPTSAPGIACASGLVFGQAGTPGLALAQGIVSCPSMPPLPWGFWKPNTQNPGGGMSWT